MATELFSSDRATTTVSSGGTTAPAGGTSESWTVASSALFGAAATGVSQFHVADPAAPSEIIAVTNVSGVTWTVTRGAESTTPVAHTAGFTIWQVATSGWLSTVATTTGGDLSTGPAVSSTHLAITSLASVSGTQNLDPLNTRVFTAILTGNTTFTFTPGSSLTAGISYSFTLSLFQDATGGRTVTWPGSVAWIGGTTPTLNTAASALNQLTFATTNAGTTWRGALISGAPATVTGDLGGATASPTVVSTHLPVVTNATATGTVNLDATSTRVFNVTETGNVTFTFTSAGLVSATSYSFTLYLFQDATGGRTTTWPGSVTWVGGTAPTLATTAGALNVLTFETVNQGTTWYGTLIEAPSLPLTVVNGGTGGAAFGAYQVLTGGTTSTSPVQPVGSVGTSGQVLTSNGASALPTWQAAAGGLPSVFVPQDYSWAAWAFGPALQVGNTASSAGVVQLVQVVLRNVTTITNVLLFVGVAGTSLTSTANFAGLYNSSGTLLSATADQTTPWQSTGLKTMALTSTQTNLAAGVYYVGWVYNGTGTAPSWARAASTTLTGAFINAGLTAAAYRFATSGTGITTLANVTMSSNGQATTALWAAVS